MNPARADTEMPVAELYDLLGRYFESVLEVLDEDEIVAGSVQLREPYLFSHDALLSIRVDCSNDAQGLPAYVIEI